MATSVSFSATKRNMCHDNCGEPQLSSHDARARPPKSPPQHTQRSASSGGFCAGKQSERDCTRACLALQMAAQSLP
eukprot:304053-Pleurochrysis_carterae.AAC.1